eukprot:c23041_g1_i1.p1 GENE.c23041_g1_i1~~c23041_g1_i1.p1  ORF type:complete len:209 (-),score=60.32 c23041_g1_i1:189-815(-)
MGVSVSEKMGGPIDVSEYLKAVKPAETNDYVMNQTMLRVKDPRKALDFYIHGLGMSLMLVRDFPQWNFSLYFLGFCDSSLLPTDEDERWRFTMKYPATIELTYNYGSESQEGRVYNTGNSDGGIKGGFGHLGVSVPDVYAACERLHKMGVEFQKSPNSGGMKGLAFAKDPDGYWIEIIPQVKPTPVQDVDCLGVRIGDGGSYTGGGSK